MATFDQPDAGIFRRPALRTGFVPFPGSGFAAAVFGLRLALALAGDSPARCDIDATEDFSMAAPNAR
ncbi:MAG: hypothetical protein JJU19_10405 [Pararhodobacter sp.]|nr:hypothetical protein [Pararhodobacter sp.]